MAWSCVARDKEGYLQPNSRLVQVYQSLECAKALKHGAWPTSSFDEIRLFINKLPVVPLMLSNTSGKNTSAQQLLFKKIEDAFGKMGSLQSVPLDGDDK
jgi:hypothetical protein